MVQVGRSQSRDPPLTCSYLSPSLNQPNSKKPDFAYILLDKDLGIRSGSRSRQSRDLPVGGKKQITRRPTKKNQTRSGDPPKNLKCFT